MNDIFMIEALKEAKKALKLGEIPVGCVITKDDKIIARAHNKKNISKIATDHAEILAIQQACKSIGDWRLNDCKIYVTLEPCKMCYGAIEEARISNIIIGTNQEKTQSYSCKVERECLSNECSLLIEKFFKKIRNI